uniref:Uncharacterized protein n=1 Tax=Glossina austeni TaxID=7395 RepID=A0A1A9UGL6_GLOAU
MVMIWEQNRGARLNHSVTKRGDFNRYEFPESDQHFKENCDVESFISFLFKFRFHNLKLKTKKKRKMCCRNSRYWFENLDMIPYSNIDYSIQRICLNCCDNQKHGYCWPQSRTIDQYRCGGVFTYGDNPKEWSRPLMAHTHYNQKQNRLESMTRKGVCTSKFIKCLMQSRHYDRKNREEEARYNFGDPFETRVRSTNPPLSEDADFGDYFGDNYFQQWVNLRRDNSKKKIFPQMTRKWTKTWYEFYRDVVAPDSNGSWYDFNKLKKRCQRKKRSDRRKATNGQQQVTSSGNGKSDNSGSPQTYNEVMQNMGDEHIETTSNDQARRNEEVDALIEDTFNPFTSEPRRSRQNRRAVQEIEEPEDSYSEELLSLTRKRSLLQPFVFHAPFSKNKVDTFKQKIYVTEENDPDRIDEKDQNYEEYALDEQGQALQRKDVSKNTTKSSKPRLSKKQRRQLSHHFSASHSKYMDALEKMRRRKLRDRRSRSHSRIR